MPGHKKFVPPVRLAKVVGSNSGASNLALDVFCAAEGIYWTDLFHNDLK